MIAWFRKHLLPSRKPHRTRGASHSFGIRADGLRRPVIEPLELRRLLTVTASETSGALNVQISGTDTAVITEDVDHDVLVEDSTGTVVFVGLAANVISITVTSSGANDTTDLTELGSSSDFTSLATIDIGAGSGAQVLLSGTYATSSDQTYAAAVTLKGNTTLNSGGSLDLASTINGGFTLTNQTKTGVTFAGAIGKSAALANLFVNSGPVDLNASSIHTLGGQSYATAVTLSTNTTLSSDNQSVEFDSTVDGAFSLTTSTGSQTIFEGAVGASARLTSLTTSGAGQTVLSAAVNTSGSQSYKQDVVLSGIAQGDQIALSTQGGNVTFSGTVDSFAKSGLSQFTLSVDDGGAGTTTFDGTVGTVIGLDNLTVTSGAIDLNGGSVQTSGTQKYNAPTQLTVDTVLTSTGSGDITFSQTLDSSIAGPFALTVNTAGTTTFGGLVGGVVALRTLTTDAPGTTAINGGVTTTAAQTYNDAVNLGSLSTALTSTGGGAITFSMTLDGASALSVNTSGATTLNGIVGGTTKLSSITTNAPGTTTINGGPVTTTGNQIYNDAVTLGADATIAATAAGKIAFNNTLDGAFALVVNTAGTTTFGGPVGGATALVSLTTDAPGTTAINGSAITTTGTQTYDDNVTLGGAATTLTSTSGAITFAQNVDGAANLTVDGTAGTTFAGTVGGNAALASLSVTGSGMTVLTANVTTTGDQNYEQNVGLNGNVVLDTQGGNIFFADNIDSQAGTGSPLFSLSIDTTVAGMTTFQGPVGTEVELASLAVTSGEIDLNGGTVLTTGAQSYDGPTAITTDTTLTSTASGNITFSQTLDSAEVPFSLSVNTAGTTTFGGVVGSLGALATLTADSAGTTAINGGGVTTTGKQTYNDVVTLGSTTTLLNSTGGAVISFGQKLDGASALTVSTAGLTILGGPVGGTTPLASLAVNVGATHLSGLVSTTGNQSYQGPVTLLQNATLTTRGGNVSFANTIDGFSLEGAVPAPVALTIDTTNAGAAPAGGLVLFGGDIGATVPLSTLTVIAAGPLTLAHRITTDGNQLFTVVPSVVAANGLTVAAGGSLVSSGAVELRSGGNLTIASGGSITASNITLRGDFNNANSAAASAVLLAGNLQSPTVAVFTGNGNTTVDVLRTLANTATIITGGAGVDTYNLSSVAPATNGVVTTLAGAVVITGGSGANTLVLGDAADLPGLPGTLTASLITGFGMAGIQYTGLQSIVFRLSSGAAETLTIVSTSPGTAVAVNGGQTVVVGGAPGGLDQIAGPLAVNGANVLDINDGLSATPHTYDISADFFLRTDAAASNLAVVNSAAVPGQVGIALANVKNVTINGGTANNVYNIFLPLAPGQTVVIRGRGADNDVNVIGSTAGPNTAYVGNIGSGDPVQIGGVDCLTMYGAVNQPNAFVNQTPVRSILIGGLGNDTLVGGSGPDVLFGGGGNDLLVAGGTTGSPGTDYTFAGLLPVYLANGMVNANVGDATLYPGLQGTSIIDGGGGVVVYFFNGTQVFNASSVTMMECDLAGSRALLQSIFNQAAAGNECLATLTSPPARPGSVGTLATAANYGSYVERAYQEILGRAADPAALSYWTAQLAGGLPRDSFANALTHSDEYYQRLVAADYQTYLGRAGDAATLSYWANQFEHGLSDQQFESLLLGSDEFYQRSGGDNSAWINAVYEALLGRSADAQSESYWNNQLQAGVSRQAIAYNIAISPEALALVVEADYQHDFGRMASAAEVNYWVGQLQSGVSNESVIASFVASDEFFSTS